MSRISKVTVHRSVDIRIKVHRINDLQVAAQGKFFQGRTDGLQRLSEVFPAVGGHQDKFSACMPGIKSQFFEDALHFHRSRLTGRRANGYSIATTNRQMSSPSPRLRRSWL